MCRTLRLPWALCDREDHYQENDAYLKGYQNASGK
jgi:hypothetical protein